MIFHIEGPAKSGKSTIANAIRNDLINHKRGALLLDEQTEGEPIHLLEKLIDSADPFEAGTAASKTKWKKDGVVIAVGKQIALIDELEKLAPGFKKQFGPVSKVTLSTAK